MSAHPSLPAVLLVPPLSLNKPPNYSKSLLLKSNRRNSTSSAACISLDQQQQPNRTVVIIENNRKSFTKYALPANYGVKYPLPDAPQPNKASALRQLHQSENFARINAAFEERRSREKEKVSREMQMLYYYDYSHRQHQGAESTNSNNSNNNNNKTSSTRWAQGRHVDDRDAGELHNRRAAEQYQKMLDAKTRPVIIDAKQCSYQNTNSNTNNSNNCYNSDDDNNNRNKHVTFHRSATDAAAEVIGNEQKRSQIIQQTAAVANQKQYTRQGEPSSSSSLSTFARSASAPVKNPTSMSTLPGLTGVYHHHATKPKHQGHQQQQQQQPSMTTTNSASKPLFLVRPSPTSVPPHQPRSFIHLAAASPNQQSGFQICHYYYYKNDLYQKLSDDWRIIGAEREAIDQRQSPTSLQHMLAQEKRRQRVLMDKQRVLLSRQAQRIHLAQEIHRLRTANEALEEGMNKKTHGEMDYDEKEVGERQLQQQQQQQFRVQKEQNDGDDGDDDKVKVVPPLLQRDHQQPPSFSVIRAQHEALARNQEQWASQTQVITSTMAVVVVVVSPDAAMTRQRMQQQQQEEEFNALGNGGLVFPQTPQLETKQHSHSGARCDFFSFPHQPKLPLSIPANPRLDDPAFWNLSPRRDGGVEVLEKQNIKKSHASVSQKIDSSSPPPPSGAVAEGESLCDEVTHRPRVHLSPPSSDDHSKVNDEYRFSAGTSATFGPSSDASPFGHRTQIKTSSPSSSSSYRAPLHLDPSASAKKNQATLPSSPSSVPSASNNNNNNYIYNNNNNNNNSISSNNPPIPYYKRRILVSQFHQHQQQQQQQHQQQQQQQCAAASPIVTPQHAQGGIVFGSAGVLNPEKIGDKEKTDQAEVERKLDLLVAVQQQQQQNLHLHHLHQDPVVVISSPLRRRQIQLEKQEWILRRQIEQEQLSEGHPLLEAAKLNLIAPKIKFAIPSLVNNNNDNNTNNNNCYNDQKQKVIRPHLQQQQQELASSFSQLVPPLLLYDLILSISERAAWFERNSSMSSSSSCALIPRPSQFKSSPIYHSQLWKEMVSRENAAISAAQQRFLQKQRNNVGLDSVPERCTSDDEGGNGGIVTRKPQMKSFSPYFFLPPKSVLGPLLGSECGQNIASSFCFVSNNINNGVAAPASTSNLANSAKQQQQQQGHDTKNLDEEDNDEIADDADDGDETTPAVQVIQSSFKRPTLHSSSSSSSSSLTPSFPTIYSSKLSAVSTSQSSNIFVGRAQLQMQAAEANAADDILWQISQVILTKAVRNIVMDKVVTSSYT